MSFEVNKVQAGIECPGELQQEVNDNVIITTVCESVSIEDGDQITFVFAGTGPLSPTEDTELDTILSTFSCAVETYPALGDSLGIQDGGVDLPNTPHTTMNFGDGLTAVDDGGRATISISGALTGDLPVAQTRRTTGLLGIPLVWTDLDFDTTDVENDDTVLEHDPVNQDRILIKADGLYMIYYHFNVDDESEARVRIDDTTVIPGSEKESGDASDVNDIVATVTATCFASLTSGQFLTLQVQARTTAEDILAGGTFIVMKARGSKGDTGDPGATGSGSNIILKDESVNVTNTPHTIINFTGSNVQVTDSGAGEALVTISDPIFGSQFQQVSSDANSSTTSAVYQNKLTLTTGSLPNGLYRIGYHIETSNNDTSGRTECRVELNNITTMVEPSNEAEDSSDWVPFSGFDYRTLNGINTLDLDYRQLVAGTSTVRRARLEIWRIN